MSHDGCDCLIKLLLTSQNNSVYKRDGKSEYAFILKSLCYSRENETTLRRHYHNPVGNILWHFTYFFKISYFQLILERDSSYVSIDVIMFVPLSHKKYWIDLDETWHTYSF